MTMSDPIREALERIAAEQKVYKGHGVYVIVPALTAEEAQSVAREALSLLTTKASDDELVEAFVDLRTHRESWRKAIILARDFASEGSEDPEADRLYWNHELRAFDRTFAAISSMPTIADEGEQ
jgi:DNA-binding GntR family transcriptional regulator